MKRGRDRDRQGKNGHILRGGYSAYSKRAQRAKGNEKRIKSYFEKKFNLNVEKTKVLVFKKEGRKIKRIGGGKKGEQKK